MKNYSLLETVSPFMYERVFVHGVYFIGPAAYKMQKSFQIKIQAG
jgi:hypothetical protein